MDPADDLVCSARFSKANLPEVETSKQGSLSVNSLLHGCDDTYSRHTNQSYLCTALLCSLNPIALRLAHRLIKPSYWSDFSEYSEGVDKYIRRRKQKAQDESGVRLDKLKGNDLW